MRTKNPALMEEIIKYIDNSYSKEGIIPTMREISKALNISLGCVSNYVSEMKAKGLIKYNGGSRTIKTESISKFRNSIQYLPVVGSIACGLPIFAEENIEYYLPVPREFLGNGKHFILKAKGDSMINAGISDGDYVIVRQQDTAAEGQIVVALVNDEATLKRFYLDKDKKKVRLHPENNKMRDMLFDNIIIQGIAVKVIKDLI